MNKGRRTAGEWKFRREDYKKSNRWTGSRWNDSVGAFMNRDRRAQKKKGLTMDEIREAVKGVKGIGEKRASEIITALEAKIHG